VTNEIPKKPFLAKAKEDAGQDAKALTDLSIKMSPGITLPPLTGVLGAPTGVLGGYASAYSSALPNDQFAALPAGLGYAQAYSSEYFSSFPGSAWERTARKALPCGSRRIGDNIQQSGPARIIARARIAPMDVFIHITALRNLDILSYFCGKYLRMSRFSFNSEWVWTAR
jgi:hypothetical protein